MRYQWPRKRKNPDRSRQRHEWSVAGSGPVTEAAVLSARRARAASATLRKLTANAPGARAAPQGTEHLWVPIGPSVVVKGQAYNAPRVAGRVRDLAVSEDGMRAYAATANGGVWFTGDQGVTWAPLGNWLPTPGERSTRVAQTALTCGCIHVKFGPGAQVDLDEVYVGTGELQPDQLGTPGGKNGGVGVLRLKTTTTAALDDPFGEHWERGAPNLAGFGIYRIARLPGFVGDDMVAATSNGVFTHTGPFFADAEWDPVESGPLASVADEALAATDVLYMESGSKPRLVVALWGTRTGSRTGIYYSESGIAGPFEKIQLPDLRTGRIALAHTGSSIDPDRLYVLGKGPKLSCVDFSAGASPAVGEVVRLPRDLFGKKDKYLDESSDYNMSIAVDPTNSRMVFIGGSGVGDRKGQWNAALFRSLIKPNAYGDLDFGFSAKQDRPDLDETWVGLGIHADVHRIRLIAVGGFVQGWIACDGGVFHSPRADVNNMYFSRNVGLAVLEGGYVASHPTSDHFVILGTQDNGVNQRAGDSVWLHTHVMTGDGGGVAFHPIHPRFFAGQYTGATWTANDEIWEGDVLLRRTFMPPVMRKKHEDSEKEEDFISSFYSGIDVQAVGPPSTAARVAIGTNRVWVSEDWETATDSENTWKTLPSGVDPRVLNPRNVGKDVPRSDVHPWGPVVATRWARDHRLFVLHERAVLVFTPPAPDTTTRWTRTVLTAHVSYCGRFTNDDVGTPSSPYLPPLGEWSDIALDHDADGLTTCYVACTGYAELVGNDVREATRMDTLWWHDGAGAWWSTGLRNDDVGGSRGIAAPAFAVVVDPDDTTTVYVGTALGVWLGTRGTIGMPTWVWRPLNNGLPEAAVQDLFLHRPRPGVKLLRAAIQARGVWELDLSDTPLPAQYLFLRSHPNDARRTKPADLTTPTLATVDVWPWYVSPDIRILNTSIYDPWVDDPTEADFLERRDRVGALPVERAGPPLVVGSQVIGFVGDLGTMAPIQFVFDELLHVHVLLHYRDVTPLPAADARAALFIRPLPATVEEWEGVEISDLLRNAIIDLLTAAVPATWRSTVGMMPADLATPRRSPAQDIDARMPRRVTFDVEMGGLLPGLYLLLAVVSATVDPVSTVSLADATLKELVLNSHHVAMRVLRKV